MSEIAIDATPLLLRSAGVKNYFYYWIRHLRLADPSFRIRLFPYLGELGLLDHSRSVLSPIQTYPRLALLYFVNVPGNPAIDWITRNADVVHLTNQLRVPPRHARLSATVHDMTCWLMPELHTAANVRADKNYGEKVLARAAGLIAVSESTKRDTVEQLGVDPDRIEVIYPGVAEEFFYPNIDGVERVRARYGLKRPYVLCLGTIEPRKNVGGLLDAWAEVPAALREETDLVVAGPEGWASEKVMARLNASGGVRYIGYVPEPELPSLTAGASVFAYPSLYEGFGFPVAQALAAGVPVVVSNISSLPELAGDAGMLVDPRSPSEIASAIAHLLESPTEREHRAARGRERALKFRWETCASQSARFFESLLGR